jgi:ankyrin repeat protein
MTSAPSLLAVRVYCAAIQVSQSPRVKDLDETYETHFVEMSARDKTAHIIRLQPFAPSNYSPTTNDAIMSDIDNEMNQLDFSDLSQQPPLQGLIQENQQQQQQQQALVGQNQGIGQTREEWLGATDTQSSSSSTSSSATNSNSANAASSTSSVGTATTSLMYASFKGNWSLVEKILDSKTVNVNAIDDKGRTALALAVAGGHVEIATLLLDKGGADINEKNNYGWTPLMVASGMGNLDMVNLLLKYGEINVNAKKADGATALHVAVGKDLLDIVKVLLETGNAHINALNNEGSTPLHCVVSDGSTLQQRPGRFDNFVAQRNLMFQFLLQHGANPFWKNRESMNAMEEYFAIENYHGNMPPKWSEFCVRETLDWMDLQEDGKDLKESLAKQPILPDSLLEEKLAVQSLEKLSDCFTPQLQNKEQIIQDQLQQQLMSEKHRFFSMSGAFIAFLLIVIAAMKLTHNNIKRNKGRRSPHDKKRQQQQQQQQQARMMIRREGSSLLNMGNKQVDYQQDDDSETTSSMSSSDFSCVSVGESAPPSSSYSPYASSRGRRQLVKPTTMPPARPVIIMLEDGYDYE